MGTSTSIPAFVGKIDKVTRAIGSNRPAVEATARHAKTLFVASAAAKGVGRGVGRSPVSKKVSARYDLRGGEQNASAVVRYTGPAHLLNNRTAPHVIRPRRFAGTRGTGRRAQRGAALLGAFGVDAASPGRGGIVLPGVGVRRYALHPGTKGLKFAQHATDMAKRDCPKIYMRTGVTEPLRQAMR